MKGLLLFPLLLVLVVSVPIVYGQTISYTQEECNTEASNRFGTIDFNNYLVICDYPFEIEVNYDTRVIWIDNNVWDGTYNHTITMDDGSFSHESIGATDFFPGAVWNVDGTYTFYDKNNPTLTGYIKLVNNTISVIISSGVETIAVAESSSIASEEEPLPDSIVVTTDKASYSEGETIVITGEVRDLYSGTPVSVIVKAPNGNLVSISTAEFSADKKFSNVLTAGGSLMSTSGTYTVTVQYGTVNRSATVSFEFGEVSSPVQTESIAVTEIIDPITIEETNTDKLQNEILTLKLENRELKQEITLLKNEIEQLEDLLLNGLKEIYNWMS